ncbi:MAG: hypothetical protein NTW68_09230 [candidate division NC10 bacterium]|nr:hypothetical protein [candidate division NC10 bacterium]
MTLDELLLGKIREGSRGVWRGARGRLGSRFILLTLLVHAVLIGGLWLLGLSSEALLHGGVAAKAGMALLPLVALLGSLGLAWLDSVRAIIVIGTLLRSLGDALLDSPPSFGPRPEEQLATFASPERLARALRLTDLPLLLFLARVILRLDIKPLLAAHTGLGRETLVRKMEHMGRRRAAALLRRLRAFIWLCLGGTVLLALLIARFAH